MKPIAFSPPSFKVKFSYDDFIGSGDTVQLDIQEDVYESFGPILGLFTDRDDSIFLSGAAGTGKTRGALEKLFLIAENYPGAQIAICRKKRVDLSDSALATWENFVLPKNHAARNGASRQFRKVYKFPNGSEVHILGLQDTSGKSAGSGQTGPQKLTSTEWDIIYINEVNECNYEDYTTAKSRLRGGKTPYRQIIADFNPVMKTHWIYQAAAKGELKITHTVHHDNPRWFVRDPNGTVEHPLTGEMGTWTPDGEFYVNKILAGLKGNARQRFFLGEPIAPQDVVYPEFLAEEYPRGHMQTSLLLDLRDRVASGEISGEAATKYLAETYDFIVPCDWGNNHPMVIQIFALDGERHMRMICEYFKTGMISDDAGREWLRFCGFTWDNESYQLSELPLEDCELGFRIPVYLDGRQNCIVPTDHDPESRELFTRGTGLSTELAIKAGTPGIESVRKRLVDRRISFDDIPPIGGYDYKLVERMHPKCTVEEFLEYKNRFVSTTGLSQIPIKRYDDGMDTMKYGVALEDNVPEDKEPKASKVVNSTIVDADAIFAAMKVVSQRDSGSLLGSYR